jgi:hypothetical protein
VNPGRKLWRKPLMIARPVRFSWVPMDRVHGRTRRCGLLWIDERKAAYSEFSLSYSLGRLCPNREKCPLFSSVSFG